MQTVANKKPSEFIISGIVLPIHSHPLSLKTLHVLLLRKPSHFVIRGTACGGFLMTSKAGIIPLCGMISVVRSDTSMSMPPL